jgi:CxxC motif-containing protein (DUF1111 family)
MMKPALAAVALVACGDGFTGEERQGGATTFDDRSMTAFSHPAANLDSDGVQRFHDGQSPFGFQWQQPELGPEFNNSGCINCHAGNGRGLSVIGNMLMPGSQALVRVSMPDGLPAVPGGPVPVPNYGLQLHDHAVFGAPQVYVTLEWIETPGMYGDGAAYSLRAPAITLAPANGGQLPGVMLTSYRQAPQVVGLGLLAAVPAETIAALADPDDLDGDGIRGHVNMVWDVEQQATVLGRFGVKANTSTLHLQAAAAFVNDIGLTSTVFPPATGGDPKLPDNKLDDTAFMISTVAVPAAAPRDATAWRGRELFDRFACSTCHRPTLVTGDAAITALAHQTIHPYTDLLVHDMGEGLADGRPDFQATGSEFRTPPLWGIGIARVVNPVVDPAVITFLHDGRARTLAEAILWHGGEAAAAREAFRTATASDRDAVVAFLTSL